jgi:molybdopterin synthase sulfur carrier subunit
MEIRVKLFATLRLNLKVSQVDINSNAPISVLTLLNLVSEKVGSDIIPELIDNGEIMVGTIILIDGFNVLHLNKLNTIIEKDCVVSVFPPNGGG